LAGLDGSNKSPDLKHGYSGYLTPAQTTDPQTIEEGLGFHIRGTRWERLYGAL